jgi:hypothetical protein
MIHSRRFSIKTLMAVIVVSAIGLAVLRTANELSAGLMLLGAVAAVCVALMGAVILRGTDRASCAGFVFLGGIYLACAFAPWLSGEFQPIPGTSQILEDLFSQIAPLTTGGNTPEEQSMAWIARQARLASFCQIGHCLFGLLAGLIGGTVAVWLYRRRLRTDVGAG